MTGLALPERLQKPFISPPRGEYPSSDPSPAYGAQQRPGGLFFERAAFFFGSFFYLYLDLITITEVYQP